MVFCDPIDDTCGASLVDMTLLLPPPWADVTTEAGIEEERGDDGERRDDGDVVRGHLGDVICDFLRQRGVFDDIDHVDDGGGTSVLNEGEGKAPTVIPSLLPRMPSRLLRSAELLRAPPPSSSVDIPIQTRVVSGRGRGKRQR
jgi:hypothetical protein